MKVTASQITVSTGNKAVTDLAAGKKNPDLILTIVSSQKHYLSGGLLFSVVFPVCLKKTAPLVVTRVGENILKNLFV